MEWVVLAVIGAAVLVFVAYRVLKSQGRLTARGRAGAGAEGGDEYPVLLNMVLGDRQKADRLIAYERGKDPGAERSRLIRCAIERMRDDMRR
jgi:hypothetical protein